LQIKSKIVSCHTADSKPVKQEVNGTVILPPLVFPDLNFLSRETKDMMAAQTRISVETNKEVQNDPTLKTKVKKIGINIKISYS